MLKSKSSLRLLVVCLVSLTLFGCVTTAPPPVSITSETSAQSWSLQDERDEIFTLLAYAVVLKDWQVKGPDKRGHNIGSVLVDPTGTNVVFWARNCNAKLQNGTQHGEVRLMIGYLDKIRSYNLKGYTVYTTLEPCAQCSGMMTLQSIGRTVYGQKDPGFGDAIERLNLDTSELPELLPEKYKVGYKPYPRGVTSIKSRSEFCKRIDDAYANYEGSITGFLLTDEAKEIYDDALRALNTYEVKFPENAGVVKHAQEYLESVSDEFTPIKPNI